MQTDRQAQTRHISLVQGEEDSPRDGRLNTVVLRKKGRADLAVLCKQLSLRNATLNDQVFELERQTQRLEAENCALHRFAGYLHTALTRHGVAPAEIKRFDAFLSSAGAGSGFDDGDVDSEEVWGFHGISDDDDDDDDDDDNDGGRGGGQGPNGKGQSVDKAQQHKRQREREKQQLQREWACIVIQRWYRHLRVTRHFSHVKASANARGRRRTLDRKALNTKVNPRHSFIHERPRLPTTSLQRHPLLRTTSNAATSPHARNASRAAASANSGSSAAARTPSAASALSVGAARTTAMLRRHSRAGSVARPASLHVAAGAGAGRRLSRTEAQVGQRDAALGRLTEEGGKQVQQQEQKKEQQQQQHDASGDGTGINFSSADGAANSTDERGSAAPASDYFQIEATEPAKQTSPSSSDEPSASGASKRATMKSLMSVEEQPATAQVC